MDLPKQSPLIGIAIGAFIGGAAGALYGGDLWFAAIGAGLGAIVGQLVGIHGKSR